MSIVPLTVQDLAPSKITQTYLGSLSTGNTYTFQNDGRVFLHLKKTGAGSCTVTVVTNGTSNGRAIADETFSVPATTGDVMAGPFLPAVYNDTANDVSISFSEITGLTVAAIRVGVPS